jgi:hypothetical protein
LREKGLTKVKMKAIDSQIFFSPLKILKVPRAYESLNPGLGAILNNAKIFSPRMPCFSSDIPSRISAIFYEQYLHPPKKYKPKIEKLFSNIYLLYNNAADNFFSSNLTCF